MNNNNTFTPEQMQAMAAQAKAATEKPDLGGGIVIDNPKTDNKPQAIGLTKGALDRVESYLDNQDEVINQFKADNPEFTPEDHHTKMLSELRQEEYEAKMMQETLAATKAKQQAAGYEVSEEPDDKSYIIAEPSIPITDIQKTEVATNRHQETIVDGVEITTETATEEKEISEMTPEELEARYNEVRVVVDKAGMGAVLNLTDAEKQKIEKAKVVKIEEVEVRELKVVKTKKIINKKALNKVLNANQAAYTTNIVLPISGYTAEIAACSSYELLALVLAGEMEKNPLVSQKKKWAIVHSKVKSTSLGKMDYNTFMQHTCYLDYDMFVFGLLTATYGGQNKLVPITCHNLLDDLDAKEEDAKKECNEEFDVPLDTSNLLRVERLSDKMIGLIKDAVDNSKTLETAKLYHQTQSPFMKVKTIRLPLTGYRVEYTLESAHENIEQSMAEVSKYENEQLKAQLAIVASSIRRILIDDPEDPDVPYAIVSKDDIVDTLYSLPEDDIAIVNKQAGLFIDGLQYYFGLMNVECPKCHNITPYVSMEIESLLFFIVQSSLQKRIE